MARVFVSHASEDGECAGRLRQWMIHEGHEVFLDQYREMSHREVDLSGVVVLLDAMGQELPTEIKRKSLR